MWVFSCLRVTPASTTQSSQATAPSRRGAPCAEVPQRTPANLSVPDLAIASRGPVLSVTLFSRVHWSGIRRVALDEGSRTSAALAQVLLRHRYGVRPDIAPLPLDQRAEEADARFRLQPDLAQAGIELEGFVSDVRSAYERSAVVVAPLLASAGTNIKIMEAMAMGKAIVSTSAGINGLDLVSGRDVLVADTAEDLTQAIRKLLRDPERRKEIEHQARRTAEELFDWNLIARRQKQIYEHLVSHVERPSRLP